LRVAIFYSAQSAIPDLPSADYVVELDANNGLDIKAVYALYHLVKTWRPDIIHVHHTLTSPLGSIFGKLLGVPVIIRTEHTARNRLGFGQRFTGIPALALADSVICNSNATCRSLSWWESALASDKCLTIYNGVDLLKIDESLSDRTEIRKEIGVKANDFVIGHVARLIPAKDQRSLIEAMKIVVAKPSQAKLVIVGDGPLRGDLESLVQILGLRDNIIFTGAVTRRKVYEILHAIDIFVMSSLWEGFCNALVEAMAARKPIITTNVGPLPEVVGEVGKFVPPSSPEILAEAILEMASASSDLLKSVGEAGRQRVEEKFTIERTAEGYEQLYTTLLERKRVR
jgi:glycosyltransferase involved in cell wall biosynthesis